MLHCDLFGISASLVHLERRTPESVSQKKSAGADVSVAESRPGGPPWGKNP